MSGENIFRNYLELIFTTEECIKKHQILPSLILIYTAIDSASWIASNDQKVGVGEKFQGWVNKWMLKNKNLNCTAEELYAARCGVVHTLTANSSLSEKKGVRRIAYAWGKASSIDLEKSVSTLSKSNEIACIHLEDLFWSYRRGMADYLEHIFNDELLTKNFYQKAGTHFASVSAGELNEFLEITRSTKA